jgi:hypothetical protein
VKALTCRSLVRDNGGYRRSSMPAKGATQHIHPFAGGHDPTGSVTSSEKERVATTVLYESVKSIRLLPILYIYWSSTYIGAVFFFLSITCILYILYCVQLRNNTLLRNNVSSHTLFRSCVVHDPPSSEQPLHAQVTTWAAFSYRNELHRVPA